MKIQRTAEEYTLHRKGSNIDVVVVVVVLIVWCLESWFGSTRLDCWECLCIIVRMNIGNQHDCMSHIASRKALVDKLSAVFPYATHTCVCVCVCCIYLRAIHWIGSIRTVQRRRCILCIRLNVLHSVLYDDICYLLTKYDTFNYSACTWRYRVCRAHFSIFDFCAVTKTHTFAQHNWHLLHIWNLK